MAFDLSRAPYSLEALILGRNRNIAGIIPDVTISEQIVDEAVVTEHPCDIGANIADHAYLKPTIVRCRFGWSDSSRLINSVMDGSLFRGLTTIKDVYEKLQDLMSARQPIELQTAKRKFSEVLITRLETTTTADSESCLLIDVTFEQIRRAAAINVTLPAKFSGVQNVGTVSLVVRNVF